MEPAVVVLVLALTAVAWYVLSRKNRRAVAELLAKDPIPSGAGPLESLLRDAEIRQMERSHGEIVTVATPSLAPLAPAPIEDSKPAELHPRRLVDLLDGIRMPLDLAPFGVPAAERLTLRSSSNTSELRQALEAEFARLGLYVLWRGDDLAHLARGDLRASCRLIASPHLEATPNGGREFPNIAAGESVVVIELN